MCQSRMSESFLAPLRSDSPSNHSCLFKYEIDGEIIPPPPPLWKSRLLLAKISNHGQPTGSNGVSAANMALHGTPKAYRPILPSSISTPVITSRTFLDSRMMAKGSPRGTILDATARKRQNDTIPSHHSVVFKSHDRRMFGKKSETYSPANIPSAERSTKSSQSCQDDGIDAVSRTSPTKHQAVHQRTPPPPLVRISRSTSTIAMSAFVKTDGVNLNRLPRSSSTSSAFSSEVKPILILPSTASKSRNLATSSQPSESNRSIRPLSSIATFSGQVGSASSNSASVKKAINIPSRKEGLENIDELAYPKSFFQKMQRNQPISTFIPKSSSTSSVDSFLPKVQVLALRPKVAMQPRLSKFLDESPQPSETRGAVMTRVATRAEMRFALTGASSSGVGSSPARSALATSRSRRAGHLSSVSLSALASPLKEAISGPTSSYTSSVAKSRSSTTLAIAANTTNNNAASRNSIYTSRIRDEYRSIPKSTYRTSGPGMKLSQSTSSISSLSSSQGPSSSSLLSRSLHKPDLVDKSSRISRREIRSSAGPERFSARSSQAQQQKQRDHERE